MCVRVRVCVCVRTAMSLSHSLSLTPSLSHSLSLSFVSALQLSVRVAASHCHAEALVMFSPCSSLNSVLFYVPWIYAANVAVDRLVGAALLSHTAAPFVAGALQVRDGT